MVSSPPTSVILPTVRPTPVADELAAQLGPHDELLVVCDTNQDPVAAEAEAFPDGVRLVVAGDPEGCSGKANAIAAGMAAADHDRIVWTDDDFPHPPDWLDRLQADFERQGPVTEVPFFVGRDPLSMLFEPVYAFGGTLGVYAGDKVWAGAVVFERADLSDQEGFLADLRRTVSDDGLLSEYLDVTAVRRCRRVEMGGSGRDSLERHARFMQILRYHSPLGTALSGALAVLGTVGALLNPVGGAVVATVLALMVYAAFGIRRWTLILAYPAFVLNPVLFGYGLLRRTFVWGGRRYRWASKFDVRVLED